MILVESSVIGGEGVACKETAEKTEEMDYVDMVSEVVADVSFRGQVKLLVEPHVWARVKCDKRG